MVAQSRRNNLPARHENHSTGGHIMSKWMGRRHGSWSDLRKPQLYGFLCHLGREWMHTFANPVQGSNGERRFLGEKKKYRLQAMQYLVSDMMEHYAALPNQPNLWECWAFHRQLTLPPSQRGREELIREFTIVYPDPEKEVVEARTGGQTLNKDLGRGSHTWPGSTGQTGSLATWRGTGSTWKDRHLPTLGFGP
jgi:hypothetical protein